jgi:hypothetical protein
MRINWRECLSPEFHSCCTRAHGIFQFRTSALPPDASAASRFDIRSPAFDGRPVVMPDGRTHLIRTSTRKVEDFSDKLTRQQERRNRPGRASSVETRAGGTARRPPVKTARDWPLAWTAMGGLWERIWRGGEKRRKNHNDPAGPWPLATGERSESMKVMRAA